MAETSVSNVKNFSGESGRRRSSASRALVGDIVQFVDFICVIATSVAVAAIYHIFALQSEFDYQSYTAAGIIGATGLTALLRRDGFYEFDQLLSSSGNIRAVVSTWGLVILGLLAFGFALKISDAFSRVWLVAWSATTVVVIALARIIAARLLRSMISDGGVFSRQIAIVGATKLGARFAEHVGAAENGISIVGLFEAGLPDNGDDHDEAVAGDLSALELAARNGEIDDIIIAVPRAPRAEMDRLARRLSSLPVSISICPNTHWLDHTGGAVTNVGGASVLSLYRRPLEGWGSILKTIEDFVLGAILLVALSPVLLLVAIAVKLQGKGPILFAQQRHGFNNAVFRIYKFRTMTVAEDGEAIQQAQKDDVRITPLGKFLRRYSLDELPQLFNVIRGEMSLVGPRPHALAHNHQYAQLIENYSGRHKVKPGITGWAQVNGYRGETSENELMEQRVNYDLSYIDSWSLWFDFKILLMTIMAVVFPKNAV
jgi:Undecaprenyl-phosphate glucose phosphotransferase